jgi:uncharacterized protein (DUF427 family)
VRPTRIEPGPGQEAVWDYPRPPVLEPTDAHIVVVLGGETVANTRGASRVLETSHPPGYYLPPDAFAPGTLVSAPGTSFCEWKGTARYLTVRGGDREEVAAAWTYDAPTPRFAAIAGFVALYPGRMDACFVDGEPAQAQDGGFYGGWITSRVVGPFKGGPGTRGW